MTDHRKAQVEGDCNPEDDDEGISVGQSSPLPASEHTDPYWDDEYGPPEDWPPQWYFDGVPEEENPYSRKRKKTKKVLREDWATDPAFNIVYSYNELAELKERELSSVIEGGLFVTGETNNIYGQTEIGKSTLLLNAIAHIVSYQPSWLGRKIVRPGRFVAYWAEDRGGSIYDKMSDIAARAGIDPATIDEGFAPIVPLSGCKRHGKPRDPTLFRWENGKPVWTAMFDELEAVIAKTRPVAFSVDPRSWVFRGNLNDPQQQHEFTSRLKMLAIEYNCACIMTAHPSRAGESGGYSGHAVGWDADARFEALLRMPKNDAERAAGRDGSELRILELRGNHMSRPETLTLRKDGFYFSLADEGANAAGAQEECKLNKPEQDRADLVMDTLRKHGPVVSRSAIRHRLAPVLPSNADSASELVRKVLVHLRKRGLIDYNRETVTLNQKATQTQSGD